MEQTKYDVFISYSRKDYVDEYKNVIPDNEVSKIKEALTKAGITYWFDEEGIYSGDNFTEKIVANIELSSIFIYLSTVHSNSSPWTSKEIACADEFGKYIIPVRIDRTPYNKKVMFRIADLSYIDYSNNPQKGIQELIRSINSYLEEEASKKKEAEEKERHRQEEEERKRKQKEEEEKKARIRGEIKEMVPDGILVQERKAELIKAFVDKNKILGETSKICPVCDTPVPIESAFCKRCGWQFPLMYSLYGKESLECDKKQLSIAKSVWRGWLKVSELMEIRKQLEEERTKLLVDYEQLTTDCKRHLSTIDNQEALIALHQQDIISLKQKLDDIQNEYQLSVQTKERIEHELKEELLKKQESIRTQEAKVLEQENELKKLSQELSIRTHSADKEVGNLKQKIDKLLNDLKSEKEFSKSVSSENDLKEREFKKLQKEYKELEAEWLSVSDQLDKLKQENQSLRQIIDQQNFEQKHSHKDDTSNNQKESTQKGIDSDNSKSFIVNIKCEKCQSDLKARCFNYKTTARVVCPHCNNTIPLQPIFKDSALRGTLPIGYILNNEYVIIKVLGIGGFGITYLAESIYEKKTVAIKEFFITGSHIRNNSLELVCHQRYNYFKNLFMHESKLLLSIKHKSIVSVYRLIEANNTAYSIMEFIEGETLFDIMKHRTLFKYEIIQVLKEIALVLQYLHTKKIIHGDVAPQNIMKRNRNGEFVLIDFGLAHDNNIQDTISVAQSSTTIINVGFRMGYSPLEQISGQIMDAGSDIYAFGATAYYLLTGENPPSAYEVLNNQNIIKKNLDVHKAYKPLAEIVIATMKPLSKLRINIDTVLQKLNAIPLF